MKSCLKCHPNDAIDGRRCGGTKGVRLPKSKEGIKHNMVMAGQFGELGTNRDDYLLDSDNPRMYHRLP